jgi:Domain of unknown function (DUF222)
MAEAMGMLTSTMGYLAGVDFPGLADAEIAGALRVLERADAVEAVVRGKLVKMFDLSGGPSADGHQSTGAWLKWETGITSPQAKAYKSWSRRVDEHPVIIEAMLAGRQMSPSLAASCCGWTRKIPVEFRAEADGVLAAAFQAGADEPELARIAAELIAALAPPDEDDDSTFRDRSLRLEDTLDGAGTLRGEMSPECTAALHAVLDVLSRPCGKEDSRTRDERLHDAMHEAMLRLLGARDLLPRKGGAPVTALVHMSLGDLRRLDRDSVMEAAWIDRIAQQFAGHRAAKAETGGDGGAWISGPAAAGIACDAALFPIVTGNADPSHLRGLIDTCVGYWHLENAETAADAGTGAGAGGWVPDRAANARLMDDLLRQIIGKAADLLSGEPGLASMLRRGLAGPGLGGPSLPLDVGDTDDIPWHIRKAVDTRSQQCEFPSGCDRPAMECQPHHIIHRADHGPTAVTGLRNFCHFHHHILIHRQGWTITPHPDGTSEARSPDGQTIIRSHQRPPAKPPPSKPPPEPG